MRFNLLRYFSITSAIAVLAVMAILVFVFGRYATDNLVTSVEQQNVILASFIANDLSARVPQHFKTEFYDAEDMATVHHTQYLKDIDAILKELLKSLPVLKIKVYRDDLTIYSSEHSQIGEIKSSPGFLKALHQGIPASKLSFRSEFDAFGDVISNRNIIETYVPVGGFETMTGKSSRLIIEIFTDVTPLVAEIEQSMVNLIAGLIFLFAALYGVLVLIVRRADRVIDRQYEDLNGEITERKKAEKAVQESEERFRSVIDNSPSLITLKDVDGRIQLVNRKHVEIFGHEPPDIVGKSSLDLYPKKVAEEATAHDRKVIETKSAITEERQISIKQGTRDFLITKFPVLDGSGDVVRIGTIGTDITERKRTEEARERLSHAVENVPVGIVLFDSDDRLVFFNSRYADLMEAMADILKPGVPFEKLIRTMVARQPVKDAKGREEEYIRERIKHHRNPTGSFEFQREDRWMVANETRLPDGGIFTIISDITEQKQAEEDRRKALAEAETASRTKTEFLANMSHELRTPLNAIIGLSYMIKESMLGPLDAQYQGYSHDIHSSAEHLLGVIADILDVSKVEAGELDIEEEDVDLVETVAACEMMVSGRAEEAGVTLTFDGAVDLPQLHADPLRLKQILLNLVNNAIKFTPKGGRITVTGEINGDGGVALMVGDTGVGIAKKDIPKVLEKFGQVRDGHMQTHEGAGLGLPLSKTLMELHGGTLEIESQVGKGTRVTVTFPPERTKKPPGRRTAKGSDQPFYAIRHDRVNRLRGDYTYGNK